MKKRVFRNVIALAMTLVLCLVSFVPAGAVSYDEMSEEEYYVRSTFFSYVSMMDLFPKYFGVDSMESFEYSGKVTEYNADRILLTSIMIDVLDRMMTGDILPSYAEDPSGDIVLTVGEAQTLAESVYVGTEFDFTLSSFYDEATGKIVITDEDVVNMDESLSPMISETQDSFTYSITPIDGGLYKLAMKGWVIFSDHKNAGYVEMTMQMSGTDLSGETANDIYISSIDVTAQEPSLKTVSSSSYQVMDTWYIGYVRPETSVADFKAQFESEVKDELNVVDLYGEVASTGYVGTGYCVLDGKDLDTFYDFYMIIVRGDVNGDGEITTNDYIKIKKAFSGSYGFAYEEFLAADVNEDGQITTNDYIKIKKAFVNGLDVLG